jgi:hypothetical protein
MENSNDSNGNRTRDLSVCSEVPPRAPGEVYTGLITKHKGKTLLGKSVCKWEVSIEENLQETGCIVWTGFFPFSTETIDMITKFRVL